jgi:hypothetical protein
MWSLGVSAGSKPGVDSRMTGHQASGTGGCAQTDGSLLVAVWVGTTIVPASPTASLSACTTANGPPGIQPRALTDVWTSRTSPGRTPSPRSASASPARVWISLTAASVADRV